MALLKFLGIVALCLAPTAAWVTHVVVCIKAGAYLLLIAGGFIFPIGMIHGFMIWLGMPFV